MIKLAKLSPCIPYRYQSGEDINGCSEIQHQTIGALSTDPRTVLWFIQALSKKRHHPAERRAL